MKTLLRLFFRLLYHQFAFTYDLVAATVSRGRWKDWVLSVVPFIEGDRVLEIGHGPGHLQRALLNQGLFALGLDESSQMGQLAKRNLKRFFASNNTNAHQIPEEGYAHARLVRGVSQYLPFPDESFDTLVSTFPAPYIFEPRSLTEAYRVLKTNGRFIILPGATIIGRGILDRALALLFRITGETPPNPAEILHERSKGPLTTHGFQMEIQELEIRSSLVYILVATKSAS